MKYYVIEISEGNEKIKGKAIYEYATLNEAKSSFHKKLGTAIGSELYTSDLVILIDSDGTTYLFDKYEENPTVTE